MAKSVARSDYMPRLLEPEEKTKIARERLSMPYGKVEFEDTLPDNDVDIELIRHWGEVLLDPEVYGSREGERTYTIYILDKRNLGDPICLIVDVTPGGQVKVAYQEAEVSYGELRGKVKDRLATARLMVRDVWWGMLTDGERFMRRLRQRKRRK